MGKTANTATPTEAKRIVPKTQPEVVEMPLASLTLRPEIQIRVSTDDATIEEYADAYRAGEPLPPLDVFDTGSEKIVADGFHRYEGALRAGLESLPCRFHDGDRRAAILFAVGANSAHGLKRTNADKRKAVMTLLNDKEWAAWSNVVIAKTCGVADETVRRLRPESILHIVEDAPRKVERNGTTYEQKLPARKPTPKPAPEPESDDDQDADFGFDDGEDGDAIVDAPPDTPANSRRPLPGQLPLPGIAEPAKPEPAPELEPAEPAGVTWVDDPNEWVETLPLAKTLPAKSRARFVKDAIEFRSFAENEDYKSFKLRLNRLCNGEKSDGLFRDIMDWVRRKLPHPSKWLECGECIGHGKHLTGHACKVCKGRGYHAN